MSFLTGIFNVIAAPIANAYKSRQKRKQANERAQAKIQYAKQDNDYKLELNEDEWEALSKKNEGGTWKDEYVTILITSPIALLFIAAAASVLTGDNIYLEAVNKGIESIKALGVDLGELMYIVVLAAVSIKGIGSLRNKG